MRASFFFSPLNRYRFRLLSKNWRNGNNIDAMALPPLFQEKPVAFLDVVAAYLNPSVP